MADITYIPIRQLYPHPDNPRKELGDLSELAASIKENGVYQNLTVIPGQYISWQSGKMGRDINPDKLRYLLLEVGIKRVDLQQPVFTPLEDGKPSVDLTSDKVPQVAKVGTVTVKSGGYEDE